MRILEYDALNTQRVSKTYRKVVDALAKGDFAAAQVKKLANLSHGKFYRARLDDANRLLFTLVRHQDEVCALMLEVIENHDYDKSRFLRGAHVDEKLIVDVSLGAAQAEAQPMRYLHPEHGTVHLLDKPISFDDAQEAIYRTPPPLIIIGSAGSGKTALTLEKLKHAEGEVLYVTHSAFLAQSARDLYYAHGFDHPGQEAVFLSYREFVESIQVPAGREINWREFSGWFERLRQRFKGIDAHPAFEEIRGVITAAASGVHTRESYRQLGVRQSIFAEAQRDALYDLFEKYRAWLQENGRYDLNLVAQSYLARAAPRYDFVVIDEVQDITPVQLALVLKTLKKPGHFLLCGDSNQIVHPNFFSWAQVKSLFWQDAQLAEQQSLRVLSANFRNGQEATRIANRLLKIKHQRFGSIDRESNYLVEAVGGEAGQVSLLADKEAIKKSLDQQIRQSTQFAVLVMRDEDKAEARQHFATPLLFSIHEAKGLEYENIVLYRFVSDHRSEFSDIADGVEAAALEQNDLEYRRARDKQDKSLEIYKFYVNALYVALTRAIKNIYLIESDTRHPIFDLLTLSTAEQIKVEARQSSIEDWQKEARKLELQGKQEQADAIRQNILKETPVPWPVFDEAKTRELLVQVFRERKPGSKQQQQLLEIACCHDLPSLAQSLHRYEAFAPAQNFSKQRATLGRRSYQNYHNRHFNDILRQCDKYGIEHRLPMNMTPLMAAAAAGNVALVEALLERGANRESTDHFGLNALHWALGSALRDETFARKSIGPLYERLAPSCIDVNNGERLVRIDKHQSEYFLMQSCWMLFKHVFTCNTRYPGLFDAATLEAYWATLPTSIVSAARRKRSAISQVLSRNEVDRDYAYNRGLFKRLTRGGYQFNPRLLVRRVQGDDAGWQPVLDVLNIALVNEFSSMQAQFELDGLYELGGRPQRGTPLIYERVLAENEARLRAAAAAATTARTR
ncbi:MAG: UvrD-helicase domain-containing protein [Azovibrio sp.]|uniref:UvrD-helicase domain-containing protein n=1 Tax=Azovibrio sp. TaxID=1872673 RepID=UPI003C79417F